MFNIVDYLVESVICVTVWIFFGNFHDKHGLFINGDVFVFSWDYVWSKGSHVVVTSGKKVGILDTSFLIFAEDDSFILSGYANKIFDEIDGFEDGILFSS